MAEYIEREATCRDCFHYDVCDYHITELTTMTVNECSHKFVNKADVVEVRHGVWKPCFEDWRKQIEGDECSVCEFRHYGTSIRDYHYCPKCGAKMDGKGEGE